MENRATELWIKQMTAIIVIIRIMISEREVGSLGLTTNCYATKSRLQDTGLKLLPLRAASTLPPPTPETRFFLFLFLPSSPRLLPPAFQNLPILNANENRISLPSSLLPTNYYRTLSAVYVFTRFSVSSVE